MVGTFALARTKLTTPAAVSALVLAISMIIKHCKLLKYRRRIVLVTDGKGYIDTDPDSFNDIVKKVNGDNMELVVLGIDFDDPEYGFKEEGKSSQKAKNEAILKDLTEKCNGIFGTMAQAIEELDIPRLKTTKPVPSYRGILTLGDPKEYDTALSIDVERFPRTMVAKPPSASAFVLRSEEETKRPNLQGRWWLVGRSKLILKRMEIRSVMSEVHTLTR